MSDKIDDLDYVEQEKQETAPYDEVIAGQFKTKIGAVVSGLLEDPTLSDARKLGLLAGLPKFVIQYFKRINPDIVEMILQDLNKTFMKVTENKEHE